MAREPRDHLLASFGKTLQRRRDELSISQEQLAQKAGLHRSYISDIERGARNPSLSTVSRLATALEMSPSRLLQLAEERASSQGE